MERCDRRAARRDAAAGRESRQHHVRWRAGDRELRTRFGDAREWWSLRRPWERMHDANLGARAARELIGDHDLDVYVWRKVAAERVRDRARELVAIGVARGDRGNAQRVALGLNHLVL